MRAQPAADAAAGVAAAPASGEALPDDGMGIAKSLDRRYRYPRRLQSELSVFGGNYLGDEWLNTWDAGARYYLHINEVFAVGTSYTFSEMRVSADSSFGKSLTSKMTHLADAEVMIGNDCAFRAGKSVIDCDLFATLGVGGMWINRSWQPLGIIGGGMKIYLPVPWLAIRFDVDSVLHPTPKPEGDSFNADVMFNFGVSFLFPNRHAERKQAGNSD